MRCKKWWIWIATAVFTAVFILGALLYAGREEELPGGTLVKSVQEVRSCE